MSTKQSSNGNNEKLVQKLETEDPALKPTQYLLEACVTPQTAASDAWRTQFVPFSVQLFLADRPSHLIVKNSWNPVPFEHFPSQPATCSISTPHDEATYVVTDPKVWTRNEIRAACEDCDFVDGNMWFYIPSPGLPIRSPDELFSSVILPLLEWSQKPQGTGELIGSAEESLGLLYWNIPEEIVDLAVTELEKMADRWNVKIENADSMVIDLEMEDFETVEEPEDVPNRGIPIRDYFWVGLGLAFLQLLYLISKFEYFQRWFD